MKAYDTMVEAINDLREKGYVDDFNLAENALDCNGVKLKGKDFHVDEFFRFEGFTDPSDQSILYAISVPSLNKKGLLVNAYGIYTEAITDDIAAKLKVH